MWCDGGDYDVYWMARLFAAAEIESAFELGAWQTLTSSFPEAARGRALAWRKQTCPAHRARIDAEQLLLALAHGLGVEAARETLAWVPAERRQVSK